MKVIGLGHYSRVGKDTLAKLICEQCLRVKVVSFAWKLKQIAHELYGWAGLREPEFYETTEGAPLRHVKTAIDLTPVEIWVRLGTMAVREQVYDRTWVDYVLKSDHSDATALIIPDVRFPNEVEAIQQHDAESILVKVVRKGFGPLDTVADQALVDFDGWDLVAGPDMYDLEFIASKLADWVKGGARPYQSSKVKSLLCQAETSSYVNQT